MLSYYRLAVCVYVTGGSCRVTLLLFTFKVVYFKLVFRCGFCLFGFTLIAFVLLECIVFAFSCLV